MSGIPETFVGGFILREWGVIATQEIFFFSFVISVSNIVFYDSVLLKMQVSSKLHFPI